MFVVKGTVTEGKEPFLSSDVLRDVDHGYSVSESTPTTVGLSMGYPVLFSIFG